MAYPDPPTAQTRYSYQCGGVNASGLSSPWGEFFKRCGPIEDATTLLISIAEGATESGGWITDLNIPNSDAWEYDAAEPWRLYLRVSVANANIRARARACRLANSGAIAQAGAYTAQQTLSTSRVFDMTPANWSSEACSNRVGVEVEFENIGAGIATATLLVGNYGGAAYVQNGTLLLSPVMPNQGSCPPVEYAGRLVDRQPLADMGRLTH